MKTLRELAVATHCLETVDGNDFQKRARILQALWREERGYPIGELAGKPRGARLAMPWAKESMANFLNEEVRLVVRDALDPLKKVRGQLIKPSRMYANLLSSQPMAFNLFAPLQCDLDLATAAFRELTDGRAHQVTGIDFEYSPGRGDEAYTGDHSAFDVYVRYNTAENSPGFVGIEVKYHENLNEEASDHRDRYDEVADLMGCFDTSCRDRLRSKPLQQIWRDHLLAGALLFADGFADGSFVFLSPVANNACNEAIAAYRDCLLCEESFSHWSCESFVAALQKHTSAAWVDAFADRYLAFEKVDAALGQ